MLSNLILSLAISFAVGLNGITKNENNNFNNDINVNNVNHTINNKVDTSESESSSEVSYPIYDDTLKKITLNPTIASTYSLENFYQWTLNNLSNDNVEIIYQFVSTGPATFTFNSLTNSEGTYKWSFNGNNLVFLYDNTLENVLVIDDLTNYSFYYQEPMSGMLYYDELINNLTIQCYGDNNYNAVKTAIQSDIQANEQTGTMGDNIIDAITSGLGLIGDLAREFLTGFGTLFWDATANNNAGALTPFGQFALVMLGVAITMAVISLVLALIKGNTGA